ncbi:hypothetical protein LMG18101_00833 [Ralstonia flaminis]|uniref:Uncharacterized protein n=1 Tax=Ralstonia flaminis TaxID=3058597 RepID=A0ABN9JFM6_9RALS|nr:hypothetical protein LMG18101_00833 [Ralstonia sp. LMG 18101]
MEEPYLALYVRDDALCFAKKFPTEGIFEEDSVLMKTFEADSWEEANQVFYDYLGYGKYHPME